MSAIQWENWPGVPVSQSERDVWAARIAGGECLSVSSGDSIMWGEIDRTDGEASLELTDARIVRIAKVPLPPGVVSASDHTLLLRALTTRKAGMRDPRMYPGQGEAVFVGHAAAYPVERDAAGCPVLTDELRTALRLAVGP